MCRPEDIRELVVAELEKLLPRAKEGVLFELYNTHIETARKGNNQCLFYGPDEKQLTVKENPFATKTAPFLHRGCQIPGLQGYPCCAAVLPCCCSTVH